MTSLTTEPPTLRFNPFISASASPRRSYSCYNCNHSFYITPTAATSSAASPSSFRCPRCHHRHLIPHHTISPTPPTLPPPPLNLDFATYSNGFVYHRSDDSDSISDEDDYDSDNSILSFETPNFHPRTPALKSFVVSLPIKSFPPNSTPSLQSCSICMDDFEIKLDPSATVIELPCEHYFHKDCILEWLKRSNTCPLCRYKLPVDPCPSQGEAEYDTVLVVDLATIREPNVLRGSVGVEEGLSSSDATSGSERGNLRVNGSETSGVYLDTMHDEDGDVMMIDA